MTREWLILTAYILGWLLAVRLAVRFDLWNPNRDGWLMLAVRALLWPVALAVAVPVLALSGLARLATVGVHVSDPQPTPGRIHCLIKGCTWTTVVSRIDFQSVRDRLRHHQAEEHPTLAMSFDFDTKQAER